MQEYTRFTMHDIVAVLNLPLQSVRSNDGYFDCLNPNCMVRAKDKKFNISFSKNKFHCFGCGQGGNPVTLFRLATGLPEKEALEQLRKYKQGDSQSIPALIKSVTAEQSKTHPIRERSFEDKDKVYRAYLSLLQLTENHKRSLIARGLTDEHIAQDGYKSVPILGREKITQDLIAMGCDLEGIPGFFINSEGKWTAYTPNPGFYIPIRRPDGLICALQVRRDANEHNPKFKYLWFASPNHHKGTGTPAYIHHVGSFQKGVVFLMEGGLKANVANHLADRLGYDTDCMSFLAMSSVSTQGMIEDAMRWAVFNGNISMLVEAFDMDKATPEEVSAFNLPVKPNKNVRECQLKLWKRMESVCPDTAIKLRSMTAGQFLDKGLDDHLKKLLDGAK